MKKSEAFAQIKRLNGIVKLSDILDIIKQIDNFQTETLDKLNKAIPYEYSKALTKLEDIYVDLTYQRKLKVQELINILLDDGQFNKAAAGHIDIVQRPDGRWFVWDGFHRAILAGLVGLLEVPTSKTNHEVKTSQSKCVKVEARWFAIRNGKRKSVQPGELFKSELVYGDEEAIKIFEVLKTCKLDVEGTNSDVDTWDLGGFSLFKKHYNSLDSKYLSESSKFIKELWKDKTKNTSVYTLFGLAYVLKLNDNDNIENPLSQIDIFGAIRKYVDSNKVTQNHFTKLRLHGRGIESTATNFTNLCLKDKYNDNGNEMRTLLKEGYNLSDDELDYLDVDGGELNTTDTEVR